MARPNQDDANRSPPTTSPVEPTSVALSRRTQQATGTADVVEVVPRYNPRFAHWLTRVPVLRELVTWNLVIVLQRR